MFGAWDAVSLPDVTSREELLEWETSDDGRVRWDSMVRMFESMDSEDVAPSKGLAVRDERLVSAPDGNTINIRFIRPETAEVLPCVYYIHGGAMQSLSCYNGHNRTWGRMIAGNGV